MIVTVSTPSLTWIWTDVPLGAANAISHQRLNVGQLRSVRSLKYSASVSYQTIFVVSQNDALPSEIYTSSILLSHLLANKIYHCCDIRDGHPAASMAKTCVTCSLTQRSTPAILKCALVNKSALVKRT